MDEWENTHLGLADPFQAFVDNNTLSGALDALHGWQCTRELKETAI
jgi:hypothetical protein